MEPQDRERDHQLFVDSGREGGYKLLAERGPEYYKEIGRKGNAAKAAKRQANDGVTPPAKASADVSPRSARTAKPAQEVLNDPLMDL